MTAERFRQKTLYTLVMLLIRPGGRIVVGDHRIGKAELLGPLRIAHEVGGGLLFAGRRAADLDHRLVLLRPGTPIRRCSRA
jgi:hypothetical protein